MNVFEAVVFDLDDTLLDTWGKIVPQACRESCQAMIDAGLNGRLDDVLLARQTFIQSDPRGNVFRYLVETFGAKEGTHEPQVIAAGFNAFYTRNVETDIALVKGAAEILRQLKERCPIYLVTSGNPETQMQKIRTLQLLDTFVRIYLVDPSRGERKQQAFAQIMAKHEFPAEKFLSVGNRVDTDLADAKILGWETCWVRYGEYAHLLPQNEFETPDFQIEQLAELAKICQL